MSELYLGRVVDPVSGAVTEDKATIRSDRLVTHAVGVGMTGSGKTGLCISLLEELIDAGVPLIILDPKGDMANLGLIFDDFAAEDFGAWVDPGEAARKGRTAREHGAALAKTWREGLARWEIGPERLAALRARMALTIYTPGSDSGTPVDVLGAFAPPPRAVLDDATARRELVTGTVSGLLGLVGVEADPVRDPEHVLLSRLVDRAWGAGEELDVRKLIRSLMDPPFERVGVFDVDDFCPPKQRRKLAMRLNGIVAAPAFAPWTRGARLDLDAMTAPRDDPPRTPVSLFYLAHLSDSERMFFASLLLEQVVAWSRAQSGTSSLRLLLYFDEVFGYLPPYPRNPPTKAPILTLMKQARAVGVGTVLVTQNPVDLDYKALSNAGTWFVGRLQSQRDRDRLLDGLIGAGGKIDREGVEALLDRLRARVFLHHDVKADGPRLFHTRWAMSFLRGPMARREVERLMGTGRLAPAPTLHDGPGQPSRQLVDRPGRSPLGGLRAPTSAKTSLSRAFPHPPSRAARQGPRQCLGSVRALVPSRIAGSDRSLHERPPPEAGSSAGSTEVGTISDPATSDRTTSDRTTRRGARPPSRAELRIGPEPVSVAATMLPSDPATTATIRVVERVVLIERQAEHTRPREAVDRKPPADPRWTPPAPPGGIPMAFLRPEVALAGRMEGVFAAHTRPARNDGRIGYAPAIYAAMALRFDEARAGFTLRETQHRLWFPLAGPALPDRPVWLALRDGDTTATPPADGWFPDLPPCADEQAELEALRARLVHELTERQSRGMWVNPGLGLYGRPGESRIDFMARCSARAERAGDHVVAKLRNKYAARTRDLERRIREGYEALTGKHAHADRLHHEALAGAAACLQGHFTGEGMPAQVRAAWQEVRSAKAEVRALDAELRGIDEALRADIAKIRAHYEPMVSGIEERPVRLDPEDIRFAFFGLLWVPITRRNDAPR